MISPLLEKRLQPWKHFFVKKFMRLFGAITDSMGYSPRISLFLYLDAQHIFTSPLSNSRVSKTCLMVVTEFRKMKIYSTSRSSPFMSGKLIPSSQNSFTMLHSPFGRLVVFSFLTVIGSPFFQITL